MDGSPLVMHFKTLQFNQSLNLFEQFQSYFHLTVMQSEMEFTDLVLLSLSIDPESIK